MHWDSGMKRLKEGITCWTIPALRCLAHGKHLQNEPTRVSDASTEDFA